MLEGEGCCFPQLHQTALKKVQKCNSPECPPNKQLVRDSYNVRNVGKKKLQMGIKRRADACTFFGRSEASN